MDEPPFPSDERQRPAKFLSGILQPGSSVSIYDILDSAGVHVPDGFRAYGVCPGEHLHTTETKPGDCLVLYSRETSQVWIQCNHIECAFEIEAANYRLANLLNGDWGHLPSGDLEFLT